MKWVSFGLLFLGIVNTACSSKRQLQEVDNRATIKKDYEVKDASSNFRPSWIEDIEVWAEEEQKNDKWRWFAFETEAKASQEMACSLAKANARANVAAEVRTFIEDSLVEESEGNPQSFDKDAISQYVSHTLKTHVEGLVQGAAVTKTYWEKRQFLKAKGAPKDYVGYTCAVQVRLDKNEFQEVLKKAQKEVESQKEKVE